MFFVDPSRIDVVSESHALRRPLHTDVSVRDIAVDGATFTMLDTMVNLKAIGFTMDDV